jgi:hypothetical protein
LCSLNANVKWVATMARVEAFKRGDEVLSKFPGGSLMMVLAVEGLKVRCADRQNTQYWFDTIMLERYEHEFLEENRPGGLI